MPKDIKNKKKAKKRSFITGLKQSWSKISWVKGKSVWKRVLAVAMVSVIACLLITLFDFGAERLLSLFYDLTIPMKHFPKIVKTVCSAATGSTAILVVRWIDLVFCGLLILVIMKQESKMNGLGSLSGQITDGTFWAANKGRSTEGILKKLTRIFTICVLVLSLYLLRIGK